MTDFGFEGLDETSARLSRIKLALLDGIDGLKEFERTGECDERLELFETAAKDLPQSGRGVFPPLDQTAIETDEIDEALMNICLLSEKVSEIKLTEDPDDVEVEEIIELANSTYDKLDRIESKSKQEYVV